MPVALDNLWLKFKGNGQVRNRSSKDIWVVETNTNHPRGPAVAHKLKPNTRSPLQFDIDGFKRFDGKSIEGHKYWWKIWGRTTADLFDKGQGIGVDVSVKFRVPDDQFGPIRYNPSEDWGVPIREITQIEFDKNRKIKRYCVQDLGWITRERAIELTARGLIDNAVLVQPRNRNPYLRSKPDTQTSNNFA
jgi:Protein of unknown function (DUF3892)